jgi:outer membrane protein assembly factor BamB
VLVGTERGLLYGLRADNGQEAWRYQAHGPISAPPVADDEAIYVVDRSGMVVALRPDTAAHIWEFPDIHTAIVGAPLLSDGKLLFGTSGGAVYALDARSGRLLASVQLNASVSAAPALGANYIYVRANRVYALGS